MEFTKERLGAVIIISAVIITAGLYVFLYSPLINELRKAASSYAAAEVKILETQKLIASLETADARGGLISEQGVSSAIDELTKESKARNINFISLTPKRIEEMHGVQYGILPIEIAAESTYKEMGMFLGSLSDLKKSLVTVKEFILTPDSKDQAKLITRFRLNMYLSKQKNAN